jgi:hypothetical protein
MKNKKNKKGTGIKKKKKILGEESVSVPLFPKLVSDAQSKDETRGSLVSSWGISNRLSHSMV